jgi:hypothetical protein
MSALRALHIVCAALRCGGDGGLPSLSGINDRQWQAAIALANEHFVSPMLYPALAQTQRLDDLPPDVRDYLELLHRANAARNVRLRQQALELLDAMDTAGIRTMLLKGGIALFLGSDAARSGRMIRDLDLLVPGESADQALTVLDGLGYRVVERYPAGHNAYGELTRAGDPGAVDLHFELIDAPHVLPAVDVWRRAMEITVERSRFFVPSPTDRVLHNVLHAQIHHLANYYLGVIELRQIHDLAVLARLEGEVDWRFIADHLTRQRLDAPLHAHALAAHRLLGSPWTLPRSPTLAARLHFRRCLLQLQLPVLARLAIPTANLRAAFARHRMDGMYDPGLPIPLRRLHHALSFLRKGTAGDWLARLLRSPAHPRGWRR